MFFREDFVSGSVKLKLGAPRFSGYVKIQQPVTTSTYTKYGQRYWRQPATKTQNKRNLDKRDSDSFPQHNKEGTCR